MRIDPTHNVTPQRPPQMDLERDEPDRDDAPRCHLTSPPRRALDPGPETVVDPPAEADRGARVPLDLAIRTAASAFEALLTGAMPPLAVLERFVAQLICDGPPEARDAALALLRASLELRDIDLEPADRVSTLVRIGGVL